ncbi:MAG: preprotein translocase subunit SecA [Nitrosomonadales bacterium]|nr:preprotein translocase subunit SecA [Nitrosomonadales bacterium]
MFTLSTVGNPYPQRHDWQELPWLDRMAEKLRTKVRSKLRITPRSLDRFVCRVDEITEAFRRLSPGERRNVLGELRMALRRDGFEDELVARAFAMIRIHAGEILGKEHYSTQIKGGYILLAGYLAEMDTGEGKTLTATLPAITAAMTGLAVHVVTVNDYLARRDVEQLGPLYHALGVTTGLVLEKMEPQEKQREYRADVVYCTNKTLVFDYLRDRIALGDRLKPLSMAFDKLVGKGAPSVMLRGLQYAIVDEADSVFIDEARTPLIISRTLQDAGIEAYYRQAVELARQLEPDADFNLGAGGRSPELTEQGNRRLEELCAALPGIWHGKFRREEVVLRSLLALYGFDRDVHYIVRDEKVMIVDENTGRVMPDRSWERGLQQMIEIKEDVPLSPEKDTLARISYQLFFRRYLRLSGMTGTCREVSGEVGEVYWLGVVRVEPYRPLQRRTLPPRLFATADERWQAVIESIQERHVAGQPVLVGTRSVMASELLSGLLTQVGIPHQVLNAKQDESEAEIVAQAGEAGRVTIATNMAGRGTDIHLEPEVVKLGGLHVILTERHDNARVDRQLAGRCARQGDPGSWQSILSLEDITVRNFMPWLNRWLRSWLERDPHSRYATQSGLLYYSLAQRRVEWTDRRVRRSLLSSDFRTRRSLSFSGKME